MRSGTQSAFQASRHVAPDPPGGYGASENLPAMLEAPGGRVNSAKVFPASQGQKKKPKALISEDFRPLPVLIGL